MSPPVASAVSSVLYPGAAAATPIDATVTDLPTQPAQVRYADGMPSQWTDRILSTTAATPDLEQVDRFIQREFAIARTELGTDYGSGKRLPGQAFDCAHYLAWAMQMALREYPEIRTSDKRYSGYIDGGTRLQRDGRLGALSFAKDKQEISYDWLLKNVEPGDWIFLKVTDAPPNADPTFYEHVVMVTQNTGKRIKVIEDTASGPNEEVGVIEDWFVPEQRQLSAINVLPMGKNLRAALIAKSQQPVPAPASPVPAANAEERANFDPRAAAGGGAAALLIFGLLACDPRIRRLVLDDDSAKRGR